MKLSTGNELIVWCVGVCAAAAALFLSHTFYVTAGTYAYGGLLFGIAAFLYWMRFRKRQIPITRRIAITGNTALVLVTFGVFLYVLGVVTWYE